MPKRPPKPKHIWHGTLPSSAKSILGEGIKKGWDGTVYCAFELGECMRFFSLPKMQFDQEKGTFTSYPVIYFLRIDTSKLNWKKAYYSADHDPNFFGCEAIAYNGDIPHEAIDGILGYNMSGSMEGNIPEQVQIDFDNQAIVHDYKEEISK